MRLTSKSQYGLLVLADLVRNYGSEGRRYVQISELAQHCNTSPKYLEQVLLPLTHAGILESKRGANGGYRLGLPPEKVSLADALRQLDGRLMPIPKWAEEAQDGESQVCMTGFGEVLYRVRDSIRAILDTTMLDVLATPPATDNTAAEKEELESLTYYI
jgi:Rrf2 family iron-sulfur cluster assembly transcriptional regulator